MQRTKRKTVSIPSFSLVVLLLLLIGVPRAESPKPPQDLGNSGLLQMLRKLRTTARLMHTTAHPDDEDGGMLALESRGQGATVMLMTLNRGEGGQNKTGPELFDALGVLRTLELLAADSYYGVEQRFSRVVDFGFSKNAEETFNKWHGKEIALKDIVRVIRSFRPDVLVARFQGAPRDGHGNHQAAGVLTPEAFRAAGDPNRFPEQIREGLLPWQPKKLYADNVRANEAYTLRLDTGSYDPVLGTSYAQLALDGLSRQLSQGSGGARVSPGHRYSYYRLIDSVVQENGTQIGKDTRGEGFFNGIDTTLPGLANRIGAEASKAPFLGPALSAVERAVIDATAAFEPDDPSRAATPLLAGFKEVNQLIARVADSSLSPAAKAGLLTHLRTKRAQFEDAVNLALGIALEVAVDAPSNESGEPVSLPSVQQTFLMAVPGQTFTLTARLYNRSKHAVTPVSIELDVPPGWQVTTMRRDLKSLAKDDAAEVQFRATVPQDAAYTRPYWHRSDPQAESTLTIDSPEYTSLPLPPPPVVASATYSVSQLRGRIQSVAQVKYADPMYGQRQRALAVAPPLSVEMQPATRVIRASKSAPEDVTVGIRKNVTGRVNATLRLEAPGGWRTEPESQAVSFTRDGEFSSFTFRVTPDNVKEGRYEVRAAVDYNGKTYNQGYMVVSRQDLDTFYYYRPARQRVSAVSVNVPSRLKVGYIMGAGDEIPAVLKDIGVDLEAISSGELSTGDLSRYGTIIIGIRAYDVRTDVRDNNRRLLDFVEGGGTLVVQYNQSVSAFNAGNYTPFPATASTERVSVEEAPVEILAAQDPVFHYPNEITTRDFDGWVQERGLYFLNKWDDRYQPLLASHDPGEKPLRGGLLRASYGKGTYIFTGYAFFRQVPAGVPGAIRLFANLLSAGHQEK